jgi:dGTPase
MNWTSLLSTARYGTDKAHDPNDFRSPFQCDYDRIIFSGHFRRLGRKTQVHPLNENDHIHTRLSHSLETASVGRSLGQSVGAFLEEGGELPQGLTREHVGQVVQAACLAHDIGNPPFGHSGESAIKAWSRRNAGIFSGLDEKYLHDLTRFDGNAMSFRILVRTGFDENDTGMRPTLAVLGALMKYPLTSTHTAKEKFSVLQSEVHILEEVAGRLGLVGGPGCYARHPLAFLTEAADDICYRVIDLEDATILGILPGGYMLEHFREPLGLTRDSVDAHAGQQVRPRNSRLRAAIMGRAIRACTTAFRDNYDAIMRGQLAGSLLDVSPDPVCRALVEVYKTASTDIFLSKRKVELELGAQRSLAVLLDTFMHPALGFCGSVRGAGQGDQIRAILGPDRVDALERGDPLCPYHIAILVLDYLVGMTDQYATGMCRKFIGLGG